MGWGQRRKVTRGKKAQSSSAIRDSEPEVCLPWDPLSPITIYDNLTMKQQALEQKLEAFRQEQDAFNEKRRLFEARIKSLGGLFSETWGILCVLENRAEVDNADANTQSKDNPTSGDAGNSSFASRVGSPYVQIAINPAPLLSSASSDKQVLGTNEK